MKKHNVLKLFVSLLLTVFVLNLYVPFSSAADESKTRSRVIVSIGDSYSAGEGNEPFYGEDLDAKNKVHNQDWLAHRSKNAWPGYLYFPETDLPQTDFMNRYKESEKNVKWFFFATSGAKTQDYFKPQKKTYSQGDYSGTEWVAAQKLIFQKCRAYEVVPDYVTLTLGGNDAGFVDILVTAAETPNFLKPTKLTDQINDVWDEFAKKGGIRDSLKKVYKSIDEETNHKSCIIVAGYPQLLNPKGSDDYLFSSAEAKVINDAVTDFNGAIAGIVGECYDEGMDICFANVAPYFKGHEAYTDEPYINPVLFTAMPEDLHDHICAEQIISAYSMHPNYIREDHSGGVIAYANCVQKIINDREVRKHGAPSTTTTKPSETPSISETTVPTTTTQAPLTDDQALTAIRNYLYVELGYDQYNGEAPWYLDLDGKSDSSTAVVHLRAYTGSHNFFYIDRISGETHEKAYPPHLTVDVDEPIDGATFNARDYLNRKPTSTEGNTSQSDMTSSESSTKSIGDTKVTTVKKVYKDEFEGGKVTVKIPKLSIEGVNTDSINDKMSKEIIKACSGKVSDGKKWYRTYRGSKIEYYIGKTYVSIIVDVEPFASDPAIYVYNISRETGKHLSRKEMLTELSISNSSFESGTLKAIKKYWKPELKRAKKYNNKEELKSYKEAISNKTLSKAIPCVNAKGKICAYLKLLPDWCGQGCNDHVLTI